MSKVVIHKDHWIRQLQVWRLELKCKHMANQAPVTTPQIIEMHWLEINVTKITFTHI